MKLAILIVLCLIITASLSIEITRIHPLSGPTSGGTIVSVWGSGFIGGAGGAVCYWQGEGGNFGASSDITANINDSYLECTVPNIETIENFQKISVGKNYVEIAFYISHNQTLSTNSFNFLLLNLSRLYVTDLSPQEGLYTQSQDLTFSLHNLYYTDELACILLQGIYPVTGFTPGSVTCQIPSVTYSRREQVFLSLNGDMSGIISSSVDTSLYFIFYNSAPEVVVSYSPSLTLLFLDFDRDVETGGRDQVNSNFSPDCALLFSALSQNQLGSDAVCSWDNYQQKRLVVELTHLSSLRGVSRIFYASTQSIRTRYAAYSYILEGSSLILQDNTLPIPGLHAYSHIPTCGSMEFNAISSQLGGSQDLVASWSVSAPNDKVTDLLRSEFTSQSGLQWSLPVSLFESAVTYAVNLSLVNFIGNSIVHSISLTESPADLPSVIIHHAIPGTLYTHRDTLILVTLEIPDCLSLAHSPLTFSWTLSNPVTSPLTSNLPVLLIPANTLSMSNQITYTLSDGSNSLTSIFFTYLSLGNPVSLILGGDILTHYLEEDLVIDGSGSFDPSQHSLTYSWTCVDTEDLTPCRDNNNNILLTQDSNKKYLFGHIYLRESVLKFSLVVVTSDSRISATSYLTVQIRSSTPDLIYFNPIPYLRVPVNQLIRITGWVRSSSPLNTLSISTQNDVVEDQHYFDHSPDLNVEFSSFISLTSLYQLPSDTDSLPTMRLTQFSFLISPDYLLTRQKYRLVANLSYDGISTATAEMDILIDSAPHLGGVTLSSYMDNGVEVYSMIASGWRDTPSALPLKYRYGIRQEGGVHWLTPSTTLSQLDTPLLCSISGELPLMLEVENSIGSVVLYPYEIFIAAHDDVIGALDKVRQKLVYGYNVMSGLSIVSSIIYFYETEEQLIPTDIADTLWGYMRSAYWSILPAERSFSRHVIFLITEFILQSNIPSATQIEEIFDVLEDSLASVNRCPSVDILYDRGIPTQLFSNTFAALAKLDTSDSPIWHRLPHLLSVLAASTRNNKNPEILALSSGLISLKVSHTFPLDSYYGACNAREQDCTGSLPLIQFSPAVFDSYNSWDCSDADCIIEYNRFESVECSGVVITTSQLNKQSYFIPVVYSTRVLSNIVSVSLLHPSTYQLLAVTGVNVTLEIGIVPSFHSCALWSSSTLEWDTSICDTFPIDSSTVRCQCQTSGTVAVVTTCSPGSYGPLCSDVCPHGLWGDKCTQSCNCSENSTCLPIDGLCDCFPGYTASRCDAECDGWMYGKDCTEICPCYRVNALSCNHVSGECDCKTGFRGDDCATTCYPGTWGYMCAEECTCKSTGGCDYLDGTCICEAGYTGIDCGTPCSFWRFGYDCAYDCTCDRDHTAICRSTDGVCICNSSYVGANCSTLIVTTTQDSLDPMIMMVVIVVVVVVVIIIVILLICIVIFIVICCKKRNRRSVAISPDKVPLYYYKPDWGRHSIERLSPISNKQVNYEEFVSTEVESEVLVVAGRKDSDSMLEEEDYWHFIEVVIVDQRDGWRPHSQKSTSQASDTPFQAPERPEICMMSLSGRYSDEVKYDTVFEYLEPVLLPREDNTLTDLREAFVDSGLWLGGPFQFLKKNVAFMFISLANEEDCELSALDDDKIYIQRVKDEDVVMLELCVCGRGSQFECQCGIRGYCGEDCQTKDWDEHLPICLKAQNVENDANMSLNVTMANSMENYFLEDSSQPADVKLTLSSRLEKIGESDNEGEVITLPPPPIHVLPRVREKPSFPDMEELPVTKSDVELLDANPNTDEVVVFDVHEGRRRRFVTD